MLPLGDVLRTLIGHDVDRMLSAIVINLRLPIALMAVVVGAALSR
jgi:ABC-type enterobactin transport system permease subunit